MRQRDQDGGFRSWILLLAISLAMFSVVLDSTMMNVAVGAIARDLNTQVTGVQAAISLYPLVMASLMLARANSALFVVPSAYSSSYAPFTDRDRSSPRFRKTPAAAVPTSASRRQ